MMTKADENVISELLLKEVIRNTHERVQDDEVEKSLFVAYMLALLSDRDVEPVNMIDPEILRDSNGVFYVKATIIEKWDDPSEFFLNNDIRDANRFDKIVQGL